MNINLDRNLRRVLALLSIILLFAPGIARSERRDSLIVSLVTCWPGPEVYELCGHEAVRVRGEGIDSVWNYGTFDFNQPNFIYRFVKGETDYMVAGYPFSWFMPEYMASGRKVVEQDLNLSQEEAWRMLAFLRRNALPENRTYRYNYVRDNCATRIVDVLKATADTSVYFPDSVKYGTFRREMRAYHKDYPWYQFGIDLALGSGIDVPLRGQEEMFVPLEMMEKAEGAHFADGRPLVAETRVLWEGVPDATLGPSHWSTTPLVCCWIFFALVLVVCLLQWHRKVIYRGIYSVWFLLLGLTGCVIAFLVFISEHEATSPNILLLWLNPLQLLLGICVWATRKCRWINIAVVYYNIVVVSLLLIGWPFQAQSANPAFFPLMGATLLLAACYAIIYPEISYNNNKHTRNEEVCNLGARRSRGPRRGGADGPRTASARGRNRR